MGTKLMLCSVFLEDGVIMWLEKMVGLKVSIIE